MLLQRYRAIFRYAVGVAVLNPSGGGGGCFKGCSLCRLDFKRFCTGTISVFQRLVSPSNAGGGGLRLAGSGVVAQTQFYYLVCSWGSLVK